MTKLNTHIWNSLVNNLCSLCSIQISILFYWVIQELIFYRFVYIHISKDRNSLKKCLTFFSTGSGDSNKVFFNNSKKYWDLNTTQRTNYGNSKEGDIFLTFLFTSQKLRKWHLWTLYDFWMFFQADCNKLVGPTRFKCIIKSDRSHLCWSYFIKAYVLFKY